MSILRLISTSHIDAFKILTNMGKFEIEYVRSMLLTKETVR